MRKDNPTQIELFSSRGQANKNPDELRSAISYFRHHERVILSIIGLLLVSIISFSLGVRRGKQLSFVTTERRPDKVTQPLKKEIKAEKSKPVEKQTEKQIEKQANFTIQVATYKTKTYAQREAKKLQNKGLYTLVVPKGGYVQLCVGKFYTKSEAKPTLQQLKAKYKDCFIRRL